MSPAANAFPSATVFVVDDNVSWVTAMARLLRASGFAVKSFTSAEELLAQPQFQLEVSRRLAANGDATPFIFITAHDDPDVRTQALTGTCAGYFRKNDPGHLVIEAIRRAAGIKDSPEADSPCRILVN